MTIPAVLTVAGSDSSGGAGIEADLKTFTAHKVYGLSCITALTAQNTLGVGKIVPTSRDMVDDILKHNFDDFLYGYKDTPPLKAIKTGMLTPTAVDALAAHKQQFDQYGVKLVVDPVMISTSGATLFDRDGLQSCLEGVIRGSFLLTPNFEEAKVLWETTTADQGSEVTNRTSFVHFVRQLQRRLGCASLLVKGGHIPWNKHTDKPFVEGDNVAHKVILDVLYEGESDVVTVYQSPAIDTQNTHGTGCTLSSAIAANIALGLDLQHAVENAIAYIHSAMDGTDLGRGNGPLNHCVGIDTLARDIIVTKDSDTTSTPASPVPETSSAPPVPVVPAAAPVLQYFTSHPKIAANWKKYTTHPFVAKLAQNTLPLPQFLYFLKQDYHYLVNYAQIQALAAAVAPTYQQTHLESVIIGDIVREIENHKLKLSKKYDIDYERDTDLALSPGHACVEYCQYLLDIGRKEDYLGIKVALAPCLHGYYEAAKFGQKLRQKIDPPDTEPSRTYTEWLNEYTSDWYREANDKGQQILETARGVSAERLEQLIEIFNRVTILEGNFWDEVLEAQK